MFKKILRHLANRYLYNEKIEACSTSRVIGGLSSTHGINLSLHKASGGIIVETVSYDSIKDRSNRGLHIITDEENLGNHLTKIITMELLKV